MTEMWLGKRFQPKARRISGWVFGICRNWSRLTRLETSNGAKLSGIDLT